MMPRIFTRNIQILWQCVLNFRCYNAMLTYTGGDLS